MAAAPGTGVTTSSGLEIVSPELVLVDPELAADAREFAADSPDASSPAREPSHDERESPPVPAPGGTRPLHPDDRSAEARQRLMERGLDSEVLASLVPSGKRFRRRATFIPTAAAATAVGLLVFQLYLNHGKLG
jgi:hypothetical protein